MWEFFKVKWKEGIFIFTISTLVIGYGVNEFGQAATEKKYQSAFEDLSQIAKQLTNEDTQRRKDLAYWLLNKGITKEELAGWKDYTIGVPRDSLDRVIKNKSFIGEKGLYELGLLFYVKDTSTFMFLDTLWDLRGK